MSPLCITFHPACLFTDSMPFLCGRHINTFSIRDTASFECNLQGIILGFLHYCLEAPGKKTRQALNIVSPCTVYLALVCK